MIKRVLVAVNDSPAALAAADLAVGLAARLGARLRAVHVIRDGALTEQLAAVSATPGMGRRRELAADAVLRQVGSLARRHGLEVETRVLEGDTASTLLDEARAWPADLVVMGRSDRSRRPDRGIGVQTVHVLEFTESPVLVVPEKPAPW